jgi:translation initiation factor IF-3
MGKVAHAGSIDLVDIAIRTSLVLYLLLAHGHYEYQNAREENQKLKHEDVPKLEPILHLQTYDRRGKSRTSMR